MTVAGSLIFSNAILAFADGRSRNTHTDELADSARKLHVLPYGMAAIQGGIRKLTEDTLAILREHLADTTTLEAAAEIAAEEGHRLYRAAWPELQQQAFRAATITLMGVDQNGVLSAYEIDLADGSKELRQLTPEEPVNGAFLPPIGVDADAMRRAGEARAVRRPYFFGDAYAMAVLEYAVLKAPTRVDWPLDVLVLTKDGVTAEARIAQSRSTDFDGAFRFSWPQWGKPAYSPYPAAAKTKEIPAATATEAGEDGEDPDAA